MVPQRPALPRRLILVVLAACLFAAMPSRAAAQAVEDRFLEGEGGWRTYVNGRFGMRLAYPADLFTPDAGLETGDGRRFVGEDADIEVLAWDNEAGDTAESVAERLVGTEGYKDIAATEIGPSRLILSGYRETRFFYEKYVFQDGIVQAFGMEYPVALRTAYDPLLETIAASFPAGEAAASDRIADRDCASGASCEVFASVENPPPADGPREDEAGLPTGSGEAMDQTGGPASETVLSSFEAGGPAPLDDSGGLRPDSCASNSLCRLVAAASGPSIGDRAADPVPAGDGATPRDRAEASPASRTVGRAGAASERDRYRLRAAGPAGRKAAARAERTPKARASAGKRDAKAQRAKKPKAKAQRAKTPKAKRQNGRKPKGKRRGRGKRR